MTSAALVTLLSACTGEHAQTRAHLNAEEQEAGSCVDRCFAEQPDDAACYCDSLCERIGDCCFDFVQECTASTCDMTCAEGEVPVDDVTDCIADGTCYEVVSDCGGSYWCTSDSSGCEQGCPGDLVEVEPDECTDASDCTEVNCGELTLYCASPDITCDAYPGCQDGHVEVDGPQDCLFDNADCYEVTLCGTTIWCTGESDAECPPCDEGSCEGGVAGGTPLVQCDDGTIAHGICAPSPLDCSCQWECPL